MQQKKNDAGIVEELQFVFSSREQDRYFPGAAPHEGARGDDAEEPSLEALLQAVLNTNTEAKGASEPLDYVLLVLRTVTVDNVNSSLSLRN
jgi:hypothetical protein